MLLNWSSLCVYIPFTHLYVSIIVTVDINQLMRPTDDLCCCRVLWLRLKRHKHIWFSQFNVFFFPWGNKKKCVASDGEKVRWKHVDWRESEQWLFDSSSDNTWSNALFMKCTFLFICTLYTSVSSFLSNPWVMSEVSTLNRNTTLKIPAAKAIEGINAATTYRQNQSINERSGFELTLTVNPQRFILNINTDTLLSNGHYKMQFRYHGILTSFKGICF